MRSTPRQVKLLQKVLVVMFDERSDDLYFFFITQKETDREFDLPRFASKQHHAPAQA